MKKQTYDLEERLLEYSVRIIKTEELIKIFVTSIKTAVRQLTALSGVEGLERNASSR